MKTRFHKVLGLVGLFLGLTVFSGADLQAGRLSEEVECLYLKGLLDGVYAETQTKPHQVKNRAKFRRNNPPPTLDKLPQGVSYSLRNEYISLLNRHQSIQERIKGTEAGMPGLYQSLEQARREIQIQTQAKLRQYYADTCGDVEEGFARVEEAYERALKQAQAQVAGPRRQQAGLETQLRSRQQQTENTRRQLENIESQIWSLYNRAVTATAK